MNKICVIFPILESYGVVERQILYMNSIGVPDDWEIVFVDDGSDPPIEPVTVPNFNLTLVKTNNFNPWTHAMAVNIGVDNAAPSEFMWGMAIDHFISKENIADVNSFTGDKMVFPRLFATLGPKGEVRRDRETLERYGWILKEQAQGEGTGAGFGCFVMRRTIWDLLGGYDPTRFPGGRYGGDDVDINHRYGHLCRVEKKCTPHRVGSHMYVYPSARADIMEVFHSLRRKPRV